MKTLTRSLSILPSFLSKLKAVKATPIANPSEYTSFPHKANEQASYQPHPHPSPKKNLSPLTFNQANEPVEVTFWRELMYSRPDLNLPPGLGTTVRGYDFNEFRGTGEDYAKILASYATTGLQASAFADAVLTINLMLAHKYGDEQSKRILEEKLRARAGIIGNCTHAGTYEHLEHNHGSLSKAAQEMEEKSVEECGCDMDYQSSAALQCANTPWPYAKERPRAPTGCTIFLSYTSNCITSGIRDVVRFLVQHNMVDGIVTTAGAIEEDLMKCLAPTYLGDFFAWKGTDLRRRGLNRNGNLLVPNANYCSFGEWIIPIFDQMLVEQQEGLVKWTPSRVISRLGKEIDDQSSVLYWAAKNNIPIYCPALTDGSLGDMLYYHTFRSSPCLTIDIVEDIRMIDLQAVHSRRTGMILLGGGLSKHHVCLANCMRNGADFGVYVNTANEFDGSDAGARPDEAKTWGKLRAKAFGVKVFSDFSLVFPLLVAESFAKWHLKLPNIKL